MGKGIFIIGTDTDVGKTFVTAGLTYKLRKCGYNAISFKPVQSGGSGDTEYVKNICGLKECLSDMNAYCLKEGVSPHLAAKMENIEIKKEKIIDKYNKLIKKYDYVIVEGAGGIVVPLIDNEYFLYDLVKDLNLDVVIVARAGVGTINHTVLTNEFLNKHKIKVKGIIVNQYTGKFYENDNIEIISKLTNLNILQKLRKLEKDNLDSIRDEYMKLNIENILSLFK